MPDLSIFVMNFLICSGSRSLNRQPLGFLVNIWNVSHPLSCALSTALSIEPAIDTCTPTVTIVSPRWFDYYFMLLVTKDKISMIHNLQTAFTNGHSKTARRAMVWCKT